MADFGVTDTGFKRKEFATLVKELEDRARQLFGENVNLGRTFEGFLIRLYAFALAAVWKTLEGSFFGLFPSSALGILLERILILGGVKRKPASRSLVLGKVTGVNDSTITGATDTTTGDLFQTAQGIQFEAIQNAVVANGVASFNVRAVTAGIIGNVPAESIVQIVNPIAGIDTVTNDDTPFSLGAEKEGDIELRNRFFSGASGGGSSQPGIEALLEQEVEGVTRATVIVNNSLIAKDGLQPKSVEAIVQGGLDQEVADAYFGLLNGAGHAAGIEPIGNTLVLVTDQKGNQFPIPITRATERQVFVTVNLVRGPKFKDAQVNDVKTALVQHIGGDDTVDGVKTAFGGLFAGDDVKRFRLVGALDDIPDIDDLELFFDFSAVPTNQENLAIALREQARTVTANIVVNFVESIEVAA